MLLSNHMKLFAAITALVILAFGAVIYLDISSSQTAAVIMSTTQAVPDEEVAVSVVRTKSGYEPAELVINQGDTVLFTNESTEFAWPVSDPYPTGEYYPEFNPERSIAPGSSWKFTFTMAGEWGFHDHIKPTIKGTIVVIDETEEAFDLKEGQVFEEVVE